LSEGYILYTSKIYTSRKCLYDKTVIVTGATSGIGRELVTCLIGRGARVCLACRDVKK
ncbi:hypothetical protein L9F63_025827, partial [Diploptera punctata]